MSWLALLLERNSGDPRARLDLGGEIVERLKCARLPPDSGLLNDFCDLCVQWISASNYKVALLAFDLLEVAVQESGEVVSTFVLERSPSIVERLGDSKSSVREAAASLLTRLAYAPHSSPQILLDKLTPGFSHRQWLVRTGSMGVFCSILEECREAVESHTMRLTPTFCKLLADPNAEVREASAKTISTVIAVIGPKAEASMRTKGLIPEAKLNLLAARAREAAIRNVSQKLNSLQGGDRHSPSTPSVSKPPLNGHRYSPLSMFKEPRLPNGRQEEQENRGGRPNSVGTAMRRVPGAMPLKTSTGAAGAVNEEDFRKLFEQVPPVQIYSAKDVQTQMADARRIMGDDKQDWNRRQTALKTFRAIWINGGSDYADTYVQEIYLSEDALLLSVKDLRSQVCREACATVSMLAEVLNVAMLRIAETIVPTLILLIPNSAKVMATSGILACTFLVKNIQHPKMVGLILSGLTSKAKDIRRETQGFVGMLLEWDTKKIEKFLPQLCDAIKAGLGDADPGARSNARVAYSRLEAVFPKSADMLYRGLDPSKQRALNGGTASQSSSTQSIVSEKDGFALNHRPGTFGLQKQKDYYMGRSASEIDPSAARRAQMTPARRVGAGMAPGARKTPPTRSGLPPSSGMPSRMMRSTTPSAMSGCTGEEGTVSQPGSRSTSPQSRMLSSGVKPRPPTGYSSGYGSLSAGTGRRLGGATSRDASPSRRTPVKGYDMTDNKFSLDPMFDDLPTPTRSVSLGSSSSPRVDSAAVTDALRMAGSAQPNERREGLAALKACIMSPTLLDSHYIMKIRELLMKSLNDGNSKLLTTTLEILETFVSTYHAQLTDWLQTLLYRLISKSATEIMPGVSSQFARTLAVVRSQFPAQAQFTAICRSVKNPVAVHNVRVKGAILQYLHEVVMAAGQLSLLNDDDVRATLSKVITWSTDPKCGSIAPSCDQFVLDLFNANASDFSALVETLQPQEKEYARRLCRSRSNSVRDDISEVSAQINTFVNSSRNRSLSTGISPLNTPSPAKHQAQPTSPLARSPNTFGASPVPATKPSAVVKPSLASKPSFPPTSTTTTNTTSDSTTTITTGMDGSMKFGSLRDDLVTQQQFISDMKQDLEDAAHPSEQMNALRSLQIMVCEGSFTLWDANFKPILLAVFGILSDSTVVEDVKRLALRLLSKLCVAQAARLNNHAELCVMRVLGSVTNGEWSTQVILAAEECAKTLATHLPPQVVIRALNPIVDVNGEPRKTLAIKMLTRLIENLDADELTGYLPDIVPGIVEAFDKDPESLVRKAAVFALVSLHNRLGSDAMEPFTSKLNEQRQRLMKVYISRAQTASNHF